MEEFMKILALLAALRFPLIFLGVFLGLSFSGPDSKMLGGIFDVRQQRLLLPFLTSLLVSYAVVLCGWVVLLYSPERLQTKDLLESLTALGITRRRFDIVVLLVVPLMIAAPSIVGIWKGSSSSNLVKWMHLILAGVIQAIFLIISLFFSIEASNRMITWNWGAGYQSAEGFYFEHLFFGVWFCVVLMVYLVLGLLRLNRILSGNSKHPPTPTLTHTHLLLVLLCLGLTGISFCLDLWRVPVLTGVVLLFGMLIKFCKPDHYFETVPIEEPKPLLPKETLEAVKGDSAVIVTAAGGGILLAAWTAKVLCELDKIHGFRERVRLVSSVSGGSVGSLYWLQGLYEKITTSDNSKARDHDRAFRAAHRSSLDNVTWGLVYPDFLRIILPFIPSLKDRGWAIEQTWKQDWNFPEKLTDWRDKVRSGSMPAVIFNATAAETGEKVMIATTDLDEAPTKKGTGERDLSLRRTFYEIHPELDLSPVSAARLSATFPLVTPAARAKNGEEETHFVDGGYYDNYGSASVAQWLRDAIPKDGKGKVKRILVVAITGFRPEKVEEEKDIAKIRGGGGWVFQLLAPFKTLISVRTTSQRSRRHVENKLLDESIWGRGVEIKTVEFNYPDKNGSLSWHLTQEEVQNVEKAWEVLTEKKEKVEKWLKSAKSDTHKEFGVGIRSLGHKEVWDRTTLNLRQSTICAKNFPLSGA